MKQAMQAILEVLGDSGNVLIASHAQPDGDALGAMAAMAFMLKQFGKRVEHYNVSGIPKDFRLLELSGPWRRSLAELGDFSPDVYVVLDCGDAARAGPELAPLILRKRSVNIDHHLGNPLFGTAANWVDPKMVASAQMVGYLAREAGFELGGLLGEAVYLGLNADTGSFRFDSTTPEAFELAADIVRNGLRLGKFFTKYEKQWSQNRLRLWGNLMQNIQVHCGGRVVLSLINADMLAAYGAGRDDLENFASFLQCLRGVDVTLLLRENGPGRSKASLRSVDAVNVQAMAAEFNGGGHRNAAGADLNLDPEAAAPVLLDAVSRHLALAAEKGYGK